MIVKSADGVPIAYEAMALPKRAGSSNAFQRQSSWA
jgi:hypothetical protein